MGELILVENNGITPGWEILDSIIVTSKTIHSINSDKLKSMIIKLHISKACDKVRLNFL